MYFLRKQKTTNYLKIFGIVVAAVALVGAVAFILYKVFGKRCLCESDYCDDCLDDDCDCGDDEECGCGCEACSSEEEPATDKE